MHQSVPNHFEDSSPAHSPPAVTTAISQQADTSLGLVLRNDINSHVGKSGFKLLTTGSESFAMRLALIQAADKTLDLQYYSINDDTTSNLLLEALLQAARRKVRIRFLLDDINFAEVKETFSVLNSYKDIDVRIFNPFSTTKKGFITKWINIMVRLESITRRMHNKAIIADNQMAIIGGRNLGDEYFEEHTDVAFRDIDILTAGTITAKISNSFDEYWNSKDAIPLTTLVSPENDIKKINHIRSALRKHWAKILKTDKGKKLLSKKMTDCLQDGNIHLVWASSYMVADSPKKIDSDSPEQVGRPITKLHSLLEKADHEFIAVSPYFVPRNNGVAWLAGLVKRGIKVKILTNSLGSTDVVAVHTGYRHYRNDLLNSGVELYELKPIGGKRPRQRIIGKKAPALASLHAKLYVIDRKIMMIGSFNLDPRSSELNTELALVIENVELSNQLINMFDNVTAPDTSYHLVISPPKDENSTPQKITWRATEKGIHVEFRSEPQSGWWRSIEAAIIGLIPLENNL